MATTMAAKAEARIEVLSNFPRAASRLARIVGTVQHAATPATGRSCLARQRFVNAQQKSKKLEVLQNSVAHLGGLLAW
jgi:hypothetical protein